MATRFTKEMRIFEALQIHPGVQDVLARYGMNCLFCMGATMESLENGAKMHEIDLERLLAELNGLVENRHKA